MLQMLRFLLKGCQGLCLRLDLNCLRDLKKVTLNRYAYCDVTPSRVSSFQIKSCCTTQQSGHFTNLDFWEILIYN